MAPPITTLGIWKPTPRPAAPRPSRSVARRTFAAAQTGRLYGDWATTGVGPVTELRGTLAVLRARARQLEHSSPLARRFLELVEENIIGPDGLMFQATNRLGANGMLNLPVNAAIEDAWAEWGRVGVCTRDGRDSFTRFCQLVVRHRYRDGEVFILLAPGAGPMGFQVHLIDPELVDDSYEAGPYPDGSLVRQGVEIDRYGRPLAYHIWPMGRLDYSTYVTGGRQRVPAEQVIHWFEQRRKGQLRGESRLAPSMALLRQHDMYAEAAMVAARVGAAKMAFRTKSPDAQVDLDEDTEDSAARPAAPMEVAPGLIEELEVGEGVESWDPAYPTGEFAPFMTEMDHLIAAGLHVAHASLTGNMSKVNYGSLRGGELKERDAWRKAQRAFAEHVLDPIWEAWWQFAQYRIRGLRADAGAYRNRKWKGRGWPWIDPLKDIQAAAAGIALGTTSRTRICADQGVEFEDVVQELAQEQQLAAAMGVTLSTGASAGQGQPADGDDQPQQGDDDDDTEDDDRSQGRRRAGAVSRRLTLRRQASG